uniref:Proteasome activator PA28 C-terminal domain-containing protein n=1 Tax=Periophthalmus magnuspinnatus TaxID=409849 RepID=A0A3B4BGY6_9GOBI
MIIIKIHVYSNERGDAVAKAAKSPHVGDYRALVHQLDQFLYCELRLIVLEIRNIYDKKGLLKLS